VDTTPNPQSDSSSTPKRRGGGNVPLPVVTGVIGLGLGIAAGIVLGGALREPEKRSTNEDPAALAAAASGGPKGGGAKGGMPGGPPGGGMPGGGMPGGGMPGGKGGMPAGPPGGGFGVPTAKMQLTLLIAKLDQLIGKPIVVELTPEQKKKTADLLADLETREALTEDEAKEKLDALLQLLESQKDKLTAAGYRWPGTPPGGGSPPGGMLPPNPFKIGESAERLKSLQTTLGK